MADFAALAQYRRTVAHHYFMVRTQSDLEVGATTFRSARDDLFRQHPLSPIEPDQLNNFEGVPYAPYDPAWRIVASIDYDVQKEVIEGELPEGVIRYERFGKVHFTTPTGEQGALSLFWILGYGGGVFLPFKDTTNGQTTYGGGRYLYDTIKGADLGITESEIVLDFNYAYHPSCFYSPRWVCPLSPPENRLAFEVTVGELTP